MAANMAKPLKYSNTILKRLQMPFVKLVNVYEFGVLPHNETEWAIGFPDKIFQMVLL